MKQFLGKNSNNRGHDALYILNSFHKMVNKNTHKVIVLVPVNGILNYIFVSLRFKQNHITRNYFTYFFFQKVSNKESKLHFINFS